LGLLVIIFPLGLISVCIMRRQHPHYPQGGLSLRTTRSMSFPEQTSLDNFVSVIMTIENVDYKQLTSHDKDDLKRKMQEALAGIADVDVAAVTVNLTQGSVKVYAEIQAPDTNATQSIKKVLKEANVQEVIREVAMSCNGVANATTGDLKVDRFDVKTRYEPPDDPHREGSPSSMWRSITLLTQAPLEQSADEADEEEVPQLFASPPPLQFPRLPLPTFSPQQQTMPRLRPPDPPLPRNQSPQPHPLLHPDLQLLQAPRPAPPLVDIFLP